MTGDEVRRRPRLSKRREAAVMEIADVCRESGLDGSGPASVNDMLSSHQQAKVLRQQLEALDLVRARLDAKRLFIEADPARHVSFFYELARNASRFDHALRDRLGPVTARFQRRKGRRPSESAERRQPSSDLR